MMTSILDPEELLKQMTGKVDLSPTVPAVEDSLRKPVSGQDLINRVRELFTPEQAEALARRIEEGREQAYD